MKKLVLFLVLGLTCQAQAAGGDNVGNGGDMCENRFTIVRNDIQSWILSNGSAGLNLNGVDLERYNKLMLENIKGAKVSCTAEKVMIGNSEKTCMNYIAQDNSKVIICNTDRFMKTSESDQYVLVHHEYAGLSGLEVNSGEASDYTISNQITYFLEDQIVKKLVVKPVPKKQPQTEQIEECTSEKMMPHILKSLTDYAREIAAERKIDAVDSSFVAEFVGKADIIDNNVTKRPMPNQNTFELSFKTKRGSEMAFATPAEGLCEGKAAFCYFLVNGGVVGLPEPKIVERKDSEGYVTSRKCVQASHGGFNRYIALVNLTLTEWVYSDLISYSHGVFVSLDMPLK